MKKVVLMAMIAFWTFYVAIVSVGVYENLSGKNDSQQPLSTNQNNASDVLLNKTEVEKHNKISDCWSIIGGKVYNLSSYLEKHPGRADTILPYCGTEGDRGYKTKDKIIAQVHSAFADTLLAKYLLGDLGQTLKANSLTVAPVSEGSGSTTASGVTQATTSVIALSTQEVSKHVSSGDCWFIISNKVYNVAGYFGSHPGGNNRLLSYCGKDATNAFNGLPHSIFASSLLQKYQIGSLGTTATLNNNQTSQNTNNNTSVSPEAGEDEEEDD